MVKAKTCKLVCFFILFGISLISFSQNIKDLKQQAENYRTQGDFNSEVQVLNKLAYLQWENEKFLDAAESFSRMLEITKSSNNQQAVLTIIYNLGAVYYDAEEYNKAYQTYQEGIDFAKKLGKKYDVVSNYTNAASALQGTSDYKKSNNIINEALPLAKELNDLKLLRTCYRILAENHEAIGNSNKTMEYFDLFNTYDRKIKSMQIEQVKEESAVEVNKAQAEKRAKELELKHTVDTLKEVKELSEIQKIQIDKLNLQKQVDELQKRELENKLEFNRKMNRMMTFGLIIVVLLLAVISYQFLQKRTANIMLAKQNEQINLQNKQITDSIAYAKTIQQAILPINETINQSFESLIIFKPKDIVSGDFYWYSPIEDGKKWIVAVVDCTGHGVPGAFMSMIGNTLLNSIINERGIYKPSEILHLLNEETTYSLKQSKTDNRDGMDVCLCYIEKLPDNKMNLVYAGAKRPLIYYNSNKGVIDEIKADRISIGGIKKGTDGLVFNDIELTLNKGDIIYLSSDGFIDQNAPDRKRYGSTRLKETLDRLVKQPLNEQRDMLERELMHYMNGEPQRDDITFVGLKI